MPKPLSKADLLLHPIRLRIVQSFAGQQERTARQIADLLSDIPQATMYRQLNELVKGGVLQVVRRNPVRGTVEKVYAVALNGGSVTQDEMDGNPRDEIMRQFMLFVSMLIGNLESYLKRDHVDFHKDGVGFRQASLYLTDDEFSQLIGRIGAAYAEVRGNEPGPGRTRRTISTILMPGNETNGGEEK